MQGEYELGGIAHLRTGFWMTGRNLSSRLSRAVFWEWKGSNHPEYSITVQPNNLSVDVDNEILVLHGACGRHQRTLCTRARTTRRRSFHVRSVRALANCSVSFSLFLSFFSFLKQKTSFDGTQPRSIYPVSVMSVLITSTAIKRACDLADRLKETRKKVRCFYPFFS
jgi:hypothetical protein